MNRTLVGLLVAIVLAIGALLLWKSGAVEGSEQEAPAPRSSAAPASDPALSSEVTALDTRATAEPKEARSTAAPAGIAPPALSSDLASPQAPVADAVPAEPASIDETRAAGAAVFEKRYAGRTVEDRREARDSIRLLLAAHREGDLGKETVLTEEQVLDLEREIEWLTVHEYP